MNLAAQQVKDSEWGNRVYSAHSKLGVARCYGVYQDLSGSNQIPDSRFFGNLNRTKTVKLKPTYEYRSFARVDSILGLLVCSRLEICSVDVPFAGRAVEQPFTSKCKVWIGTDEALVFCLLWQGYEITTARLYLHAVDIYLDFQAVIIPVGFHARS